MFKLTLAVAGVAVLVSAVAADEKKPDAKQLQAPFDKYSGLRDAKKFDEAKAVLDEVAKIAPTNPYPGSEAAWMHNERKEYAAAAKAAEKSIALNAGHSDGYRELGYALLKQGKKTEAVKALATAIEKNAKNLFAYDYLADAYDAIGDREAAAETRNKKLLAHGKPLVRN